MTDVDSNPKLIQEDKVSFIEEVRTEREPLSIVLKRSGLPGILEQLYPDRVHFVYELLQNAEDAGATDVFFDLTPEYLGFQHNGKPFSKDDIWSITDIGKSTKVNDNDTIGQFGIGFRSVFVYTSSPKVWSPTYSFIIEDYVMPSLLPDRNDLGGLTRFELPFNKSDMTPECAYDEISRKLQDISENTLLFLNNITSIEWRISEGEAGSILRIVGDRHHVEVLKQVNSEVTSSSHFLLFSKQLDMDHASSLQRVSIAYALELLPGVSKIDEHLPLSKQVTIVPVKGNVCVFFPAVKETSGLRFHLHAPFVAVPGRDSIKDTTANDPLFTNLANLCCKSLYEIRDAGLLRRDFFGVLPSSRDSIEEKYTEIRDRIIDEFDNCPLMPTFAGAYAPARTLFQARDTLKNILSKDDLIFLGNFSLDSQADWAISRDLQRTKVDNFMSSTAIKKWGIEKFVNVLVSQLNENRVSQAHLDWLSQKPLSWFQLFYAVFDTDLEKYASRLSNSLIVKLANGKLSTAKGSYFPNSDYQNLESMPFIDTRTIETEEGRVKTKSKRFLERLGTVEVDEFQLIKLLLEKYYNREDFEFNEDRSVSHIRKFIQVFGKDRDKYFSTFLEYRILYGHDDRWHKPSEIFIDSPFENTNMLAYHRCFGEPKNLAGLSDRYFTPSIDKSKLIEFAISLGAIKDIPVLSTECKENPDRAYLLSASGSRTSKALIDQDWYIQSFNQIVKNMDMTMAKLILRSITDLEERDKIDIRMKAKYRKSRHSELRQGLSQFAFQLKSSAWIPQADGKFVKPSEAKYEELPSDFDVNRDSSWVRLVEFGNEVKISEADSREQHRRRKEALSTLGLDANKMSELEPFFRKLAEFPLEGIPSLIPDLIRRIDASEVSFPEGGKIHGDKRGEQISEEAKGAPARAGEKRVRTVHPTYPSVKGNARQYLREQYTKDDNMFCQICHEPMPFRLGDGSPFVMKVEFLRDCEKRHFRNHLSLCPNHAAMFIHANDDKDNLRDMVGSMNGLRLQISLAQSSCTIQFTEKHIHDIKKIMQIDRGSSHSDDLSSDEND